MTATGRNSILNRLALQNERLTKRVLRAKREARAHRISNEIDGQLEKERAAQKGLIQVLLLGQSESGKSTFLKNLLMMYSFPQWEAERRSRLATIQLKLVRSVLTILNIIEAELNGATSTSTSITPEEQFSADEYDEEDNPTDEEEDNLTDEEENSRTPCVVTSGISITNISKRSSLTKHSNSRSRTALSNQHYLKLLLGPLRGVEADLKKRLGEGPSDEDFDSSWSLGTAHEAKRYEISVKLFPEALENAAQVLASDGCDHGQCAGDLEAHPSDEATDIIASCKDDMKALWADEAVRNVLAESEVMLDDGAAFFLDNIDRIATRTYEPSDDDIIRARSPTLGVQEYNIQIERSTRPTPPARDSRREQWITYDVGGSRPMVRPFHPFKRFMTSVTIDIWRHTWLPFFDTVNAIFFFASLSCFDEHLEEDHRISRLEDSLLLWRSVCSSSLLAKAPLVLLLTKYDILERKLNSGVMVEKYIPSYRERPNDAESVIKYLRVQYREIFRAQSPVSRTYLCVTTDTNPANMLRTVRSVVEECIMREHLRKFELL